MFLNDSRRGYARIQFINFKPFGLSLSTSATSERSAKSLPTITVDRIEALFL